jgi:hypothetical protein
MYVSQKRLNRGLEGALRYLATGSAGHRYLLIEIDDAFDLGSSRTGRPAAIAPLAHELQHALEVATADDVRDLESFNTLFPQRRRPNPGGPGRYPRRPGRRFPGLLRADGPDALAPRGI